MFKRLRRLSLNTKFQVPVVLGTLMGMIIAVVIMSKEISDVSGEFELLAYKNLQEEHMDLERSLTDSLIIKTKSLGRFMARTSQDYILSHDLYALSQLQKEAMQDPDVVYAIYLRPDKKPFLSEKTPSRDGVYQEYFVIEDDSEMLGYVVIGLSRKLINQKKEQAEEHLKEMMQSMGRATEKALDKLFVKTAISILLLLVVVFLLVYVTFCKLVSSPISRLSVHTRKLQLSNLGEHIDIQSKDEIGDLAEAFNIMADSLKSGYKEIKQKNIELQAATIAKDQFLANMTHELRTPLHAVIGLSDLLRVEKDKESEDYEQISLIFEAGKHLLSIVDRVLDIAKNQSTQVTINPAIFDVAGLLNEVCLMVEPAIHESSNFLNVSVSENVADMYSDPMKIKQVLFNLLSNAAKFTENGKIYVDVTQVHDNGSDWVVFKIADSGIGVPLEQQIKIFESFYQVDASITREYGGTGLGLAITKQFCEALGGKITVQSKLNEGAEFTVRLPKHFIQTNEGKGDDSLVAS